MKIQAFCMYLILGLLVASPEVACIYKPHSAPKPISVSDALIIDLDADRGITLDDSGRVVKWENQVSGTNIKYFEKTDEGRTSKSSGCPTYKRAVPEINGHSSLIFREQELLNQEEDALDHLITGSGYTFLCLLRPYTQDGKLKDVNSFFGNLRNGQNYEGIWGGLTDDNRVWAGIRNGLTIGRWDGNNPFLASDFVLSKDQYHIIIGKMENGFDSATIHLMIEPAQRKYSTRVKVNARANSSKLSIGQERDAIQHPGFESFDGEIARFLLYERPLNARELKNTVREMKTYYGLKSD